MGVANKGRGVPPREHLGEQSAWRRVCSHLQPKGAPPTAGGKPARRVGGPLLGPFKIQEQRPPQLAASFIWASLAWEDRRTAEADWRRSTSDKAISILSQKSCCPWTGASSPSRLIQVQANPWDRSRYPKEHVANLARNGTRAFNGFHSSRLLRAVRCLSTKPM